MRKSVKVVFALTVLAMFLFHPNHSVSSQVIKSKMQLPFSVPVKVNGICNIEIRPHGTYLSPRVFLYLKAQPLTGQTVKANGKLVPEYSPGRYRSTIKNYSIIPGKTVEVSFEPSGRLLVKNAFQNVKYDKVTGTAVVKEPMKFNTPKPDQRIPVKPLRRIRIAWSPGTGTGPMRCAIYEFTGPDSVAPAPAYESGDLFTGSVSVSTRIFRPNKKYGIYITRKMGDFRFNLRIATGSNLSLRHSVATYIFTY